MRRIPLLRRDGVVVEYTLVDDDTYSWLSTSVWRFMPRPHGGGYAYRGVVVDGKFTTIYMHRLLCPTLAHEEVDHVNRNKLDNRRANLRPASDSQNQANRSIQRNNTSGAKGVTWNRRRNRWQAQLMIDHKNVNLGLFDTVDEASAAYQYAAFKHFGEFAKGNTEHLHEEN